MKLNWFSPLQAARTDIAHYTARVLPALCAEANVTLWTSDDRWDAIVEKHAAVRPFCAERISGAELNHADLNIYHIGNNPLCHGPIWHVSRRWPGLVVLHDVRLQDLFVRLYETAGDAAGYFEQMARYYGNEGREAGKKFWSQQLPIEFLAERYPLTLLGVENALGVVVHTRDAFEELSRQVDRPLLYAPLPYPATQREGQGKRPAGPPYRLIVFGYIGRNRRLESLFRALASFPGKERFRVDIYGQVGHPDVVGKQIQEFDLEQQVSLHGFVREAELDAALAAAHLAINLRYPTMGEASGSQLRIWDHALPSLVSQVGWYASLPAEAVAFVHPEHEVEDIRNHLHALLADPASFARRGQVGHRILEACHAPSGYARAVFEFAAQVLRQRRSLVAGHLTRRVGAEVSVWSSAQGTELACRRVAEEIHRLLA